MDRKQFNRFSLQQHISHECIGKEMEDSTMV